MTETANLSAEARAFGERAAEALACDRAAWPIIAESWARGYDRDEAEAAEAELRTKVAFDRAWHAWREATRMLADAGAQHFGRNWDVVAADLDSNRIRLIAGCDPASNAQVQA